MRFPKLRTPARIAALALIVAVSAWVARPLWLSGPAAPPTNPGNATADAGQDVGIETPPLEKALDFARDSLRTLDTIDDYTCIFVKRERVAGKLLDQEELAMKLRQRPFSVYFRFIEPPSSAGQEAIYVEGQNDGKLLGHTTGLMGKLTGTVALDPKGLLATRGNRYGITDSGMRSLLEKLIALGETPGLLDGCAVGFDEQATVDERPCTCVEISMPRPKPKRKPKDAFMLATARIFLDHEWNVPVRFETHEWPDDGQGGPRLSEQYTYLRIKFNQGLTDFDFDKTNPEYAFP
ncbi:MAG TPA: DUF1571 domain-containing protein [Pirellulales bacterium]|nr:DUF1571 domain-containing protein [Pirellulales bacterium]